MGRTPVVQREVGGSSLLDARAQGEWDRWELARFLVSGNEGGLDRFPFEEYRDAIAKASEKRSGSIKVAFVY